MNRSVWPALAVAVVLHAVLAVSVPPRFESDSAIYRAQAENLVRVGASLDAEGRPETRTPPGYPLFLAAFLATGLGYTGAVAVQHVIWIVLTGIAMWLVIRTSNSVAAALVAGAITTLDLPGLQASISVLSETLAAGTLMAAVVCTFLSMRAETRAASLQWAGLAGLLAGATALVRPIAMVLAAPLAIAIIAGSGRRWRLVSAGLLAVTFAVLPAYWMVRNARVSGVATLSTLAGINLLQYRAAGTLAVRDPGGIDANLSRRRDELEQRACRNLEAIYRRPCASLTWAEKSGEYAKVAWPVILGDPIASALQAARALGMIMLGGSANLLAEVTGLSERVTRMISLGYTVPLALLALLGIPYWWRRDRGLAWLVVLVLVYMIGMALGAEAYSRFRVPVIGLYAILCAGGVERIWRKPAPHH